MNKISACILLFLLLSCKEISFKEPQPKGRSALSEIPKELRGKYLLIEANNNGTDTLIVTGNGYQVANDSTKGVLGDSLVLKKYKGYYFFNDNQNPEWLLRVVKREANGDLVYMFMDSHEQSFEEFIVSLNKEIRIDSFEVNDEKLYQIDPSPKQLVSLIRKGYFRKTGQLKKLQ
jgi:hypothetical protein